VVSLFNPFVGLLIYVSFAIIKPDAMWFWVASQGNYSRIVAIALLIGWALKGFGTWQFGRGKVTVVALVGFGAWAALCAALAGDKVVAFEYVENLLKIILPFLVGITTIDSVKKLRQLAWVIVLSQGYVCFELNLTYLSGYNRLWDIGYGSLDNNTAACSIDSCIGMGFFLGMYSDRWWKRTLAFALTGFMIHAVLFSFSRGGMLGLLITGVGAFLLIRKSVKHYVVLIVVILVSVRFAGKEVQDRFSTIFNKPEHRDSSAESRLHLWAGCWDLMLKNPVTGVGPNNWPLKAPLYGFNLGKQAHTTWLRVGAELGIPGLALFAAFHGLCSARLWGTARDPTPGSDPWLQYLAQAVIASAVGFALSAQFVNVELVESSYYVVLVGAGVLKLASRQPQFTRTRPLAPLRLRGQPVQVDGTRPAKRAPLPVDAG
jgi:probable O-glycosylation ligase (exosortase A-associated)